MTQYERGGEMVILSEYKPCHHFKNQTEWAMQSIPLNPVQRADFDKTPHEHRDPQEIQHWQDIVYVKKVPATDGCIYEIRCLDGATPGSSTWMGKSSTLEDALAKVYAISKLGLCVNTYRNFPLPAFL